MNRLALLALVACTGPGDDTDTDDTDVVPPTVCESLGLSEIPWDAAGPYGTRRRELAGNLVLPLHDGTEFSLYESWTGCDVIAVVPSGQPRSGLDDTSIWEDGVEDLIEASPRNARYLFVSTSGDAGANAAAMQTRIDQALTSMSADDAAWWRARLLVVEKSDEDLENWLRSALRGRLFSDGLVIDRNQRLRGVGNLAAVEAYDRRLSDAGMWPWEQRLYVMANELIFANFEKAREERLAAEDATVVTLWDGEVLEEYADIEVALPSASEMATFDTLELSVLSECPDPISAEAGNCGAWDYLAHVFLWDEASETWLEVSRFITPYHRESWWVGDGTQALPWLADGGTRKFRYSFAPSWNKQPTKVTLSLRFRDDPEREGRPVQTHALFKGGAFNSAYNDGRDPVDVAIPAAAKRVELRAVTSGHGADTNQCAEFCNHQHEFTIGGGTWLQEFPEAQVEDGCVQTVSSGTVPNQSGTWFFGRGGWCPGREVHPWIVDVTAQATPGSTASVGYRGLFRGATPPDASGNVRLESWLVIYE